MKCCDEGYRPADFFNQITIEKETHTADDQGGQTTTWATFLTAWAYIKPRQDREAMFADRREDFIRHDIRIRYQPGITAAMRVNFGGRIFEIQNVFNEEEQNAYIFIRAHERTGT